jgi:hypothetical protein
VTTCLRLQTQHRNSILATLLLLLDKLSIVLRHCCCWCWASASLWGVSSEQLLLGRTVTSSLLHCCCHQSVVVTTCLHVHTQQNPAAVIE